MADPVLNNQDNIGGQSQNLSGSTDGIDLSSIIPNNPPASSMVNVNNILSDGDVELAKNLDNDLMRQIDLSMPAPVMEKLNREDYFPGIDDPILKGTYSGKAIGSNPIFVRSGGYNPYGLTDARQRAINAALQAKAERLSKFDLRKPPVTKDPRFTEGVQNLFHNTVNNYVSQARQLYGDKWAVMLQDPRSTLGRKFAQDLDNIDIVARETDQITDIIAKMDESIAKGTGTYSAETMKQYKEYKDLLGNFVNGNASESIRKNMNVLTGNMSIDEKLHDQILPHLQRSVNEQFSKWGSQGTFDEIRKNRRETIRAGAKQIAKQMKAEGGQYFGVDWVTEKMIEDRLIAMMPDINEQELKTVNRPSGYGSGYDLKPGEIKKTPYAELSFKGKDGQTKVSASDVVYLNAGKNPIKITGGKFFDPATGKYFDATGVVEFKPAAFGTFTVPGKDKVVVSRDGGMITYQSTPGLITKTGGASGTISIKQPDGSVVEKEVILSEEGQTGTFNNFAPETYKVFKSEDKSLYSEDYMMDQNIQPGEKIKGGGTVLFGNTTSNNSNDISKEEYDNLKPGDVYWWKGKQYTK